MMIKSLTNGADLLRRLRQHPGSKSNPVWVAIHTNGEVTTTAGHPTSGLVVGLAHELARMGTLPSKVGGVEIQW